MRAGAVFCLAGACGLNDLAEDVEHVTKAGPDANNEGPGNPLATTEAPAASGTAAATVADPFGLAGKRLVELEALLAVEEAGNEPPYSRPPARQAFIEALYRARGKRLGKRSVEERVVFTELTELGGDAPPEPPPAEEAGQGGAP